MDLVSFVAVANNIVDLVLEVLKCLTLLLRYANSTLVLPQQVNIEFAIFEDALGNISHIDLRATLDWEVSSMIKHALFVPG